MPGEAAAPPSPTFPEDLVWLQLDRELDQRMTKLLRTRPKKPGQRSHHSKTPRPGHRPPKPIPPRVMGRNGVDEEGKNIEGRGRWKGGEEEEEDETEEEEEEGREIKEAEHYNKQTLDRKKEEKDEKLHRRERKAEMNNTEKKKEEEEEEKKEDEEEKKEDEEDYKPLQMITKDRQTETDPKEKEDEEGKKEEEEDEGEEKEEDYAIFDEFLSTSTRTRLRQLSGKVEALTQALHLAREECRQMASSKRESSKGKQACERELRVMGKQVQTLQQDSGRLHRTNADLRRRVKELSQECQALRKESSEARQKEVSRAAGHTTLQAQLTRARGECTSLKDHLATSKAQHKEEVEELRRRLAEEEERRRDLERERRDLRTLSKKQERMISVLHQQKNHLAAAKAVAGLEQKFLSAITPLTQPDP